MDRSEEIYIELVFGTSSETSLHTFLPQSLANFGQGILKTTIKLELLFIHLFIYLSYFFFSFIKISGPTNIFLSGLEAEGRDLVFQD